MIQIIQEIGTPAGYIFSKSVINTRTKNPQKQMVLRIFLCFPFLFHLADASERCFALWLLFTKICIPYCAF